MIDTLALLVELSLLFLVLFALVRKEIKGADELTGIFAYRSRKK